jgi:negative regulator of flagellin synthesis FlgM
MTHKIDSGAPPRPLELVAAKIPSRAGAERDAAVTATPALDNLRLTGEAAGLQAIERKLGEASAGIDVARVNQIRAALSDGSYQVNPQEIANRLLAFESAFAK